MPAFTTDELTKAIQQSLNNNNLIPPDKRGALFTYLDTTGVTFGAAVRTGKFWSVQGDLQYHPHQGGLSTGLTIQGSW